MNEEKKETKKNVVGLVFSWIFGVIVLLQGVSMIMQFPVYGPVYGTALILCSILIIPCSSALITKKLRFKIPVWSKILLLTIIIPFIHLLRIGHQVALTPKEVTQVPRSQRYSINKKVEIGSFAYTINSYETSSYIGSSLLGEAAVGIFLILDITVENISKETKTFYTENIKIIDSQERSFKNSIGAEFNIRDHLSGSQLNPGLPKRGRMIFDIPKDTEGFIEISSDIWGSDEKYLPVFFSLKD